MKHMQSRVICHFDKFLNYLNGNLNVRQPNKMRAPRFMSLSVGFQCGCKCDCHCDCDFYCDCDRNGWRFKDAG